MRNESAQTIEDGILLANLHRSLTEPTLDAMNLLNEVSSRFPDSVSFAAGRPSVENYDLEALPRYLLVFQNYLKQKIGLNSSQVTRMLMQYGRTKGIINELVARNLYLDEGIDVDPEAILVTVGCQEAMIIVIRALCASDQDIVLSVAPRYVGLTGAARVLDREVWPVRESESGLDLDHLVDQIKAARKVGKRPRICYLVPDFANPSGLVLNLETRTALLELAQRHDFILLEDNPYGLFPRYDGPRLPTLKALDEGRRVIYLGSFAKTCFPGARVGYAVADQRVAGGTRGTLLADELAKLKSMLTINTSPIAQAVIGGMLVEHDFSLVKPNQARRSTYRRNIEILCEGLARRFPRDGTIEVSWNRPKGGFFVIVRVPFRADDFMLEYSARRHGVLWTPMTHFYDGDGGENQIRLSGSVLDPQEIERGLDRLLRLVQDQARPGSSWA